MCEKFCGEAVTRAFASKEKGDEGKYFCHAKLYCVVSPSELATSERGAFIVGRAFVAGADYRAFVENVRAGEWRELFSDKMFQNVHFASETDVRELAARVEEIVPDVPAEAMKESVDEKISVASPPPAFEIHGAPDTASVATDETKITSEDKTFATDDKTPGVEKSTSQDASSHNAPKNSASLEVKSSEAINDEATRAFVQDELQVTIPTRNLHFKDACRALLRPLLEKHKLNSLTLVMRRNGGFAVAYATGKLQRRVPLVMLDPTDAKRVRLVAATNDEMLNRYEAFPLHIGDDVRGALLVGDTNLNAETRRTIEMFCRQVALPLEVLRLREELNRQRREQGFLQAFIERLNAVEPAEAYTTVLRYFAELLRAERGSLLLYDEESNELVVKATIGVRADVAREMRVRAGEGVAGYVLENARPLVVRDVRAAGYAPAPDERRYKTNSFISYPIIIGGRKVGVLNVTDKAGGGVYDDADVHLLETVAPQVALALDRAELFHKATQFELLSITDPLTSLKNRRYLEERVNDELKRSSRYHYPMSFMMLDIDDFKKYNDQNGHQAGDDALRLVAYCLKETLRGADVASRYGGEEFSVLLPQTTLDEASVIAERIRSQIRQTEFPHGHKQPQGYVSVSIGIAALSQNLESPEAIIRAADDALYIAKRRGKDRVELAED
ncbi:MAG: hypothetical protein NVSMB56_09670 [Pyrinomonadaceae bacterium]